MRLQIKKLLFFLSFVFLLACEEEVTPPDIVNGEDALVVNSIISPFLEEIVVEVSITKNAFGLISTSLDSDIVSDAIVTISDGTNEVVIPFDNRSSYRQASNLLLWDESRTYRLEVQARGRMVFSETTLPQRVTSIETVSLNERNVLNFTWQDFEEQENFYRVSGSGRNMNLPFFRNIFFGRNQFVSDINRNGRILSARGDGYEF
ncbi:MAG: DUF4249 family protein [Bacteroidota bacterium]